MKKTFELNGYTLHVIPTKKFKNITISCKLAADLTRETTTIRTLLSFMLTAGTKEFPSTKLFSRHLEDMYGARLSSNIATKGQSHILNITSICVNQEFLPIKENLLLKQIKLFKSVLLEPNIINGLYDEKILDIKKKELKERLRANNDDKFMYSVEKLYENMGMNQHLGIPGYGNINEVDSITNKQLSDYFLKCVNNDSKHIYIVGDISYDVVDLFEKELSFQKTLIIQPSVVMFKENNSLNEVIEKQQISQAKLNMGYSANCNYLSENHCAFNIFNAIFGGFSQSKLFKTVREKHSLCYYVSSSYDAFNGTMIVNAGIESENYIKTKDIIEQELLSIQNGNVSIDEINLAKKMISSGITKAQDEPTSIIALNYNRDLTNKQEDDESYLNKINNVTIEDVIEVSKLVNLDTIFLLTGGHD